MPFTSLIVAHDDLVVSWLHARNNTFHQKEIRVTHLNSINDDTGQRNLLIYHSLSATNYTATTKMADVRKVENTVVPPQGSNRLGHFHTESAKLHTNQHKKHGTKQPAHNSSHLIVVREQYFTEKVD